MSAIVPEAGAVETLDTLEDCPFDTILWRAPYLVLPKLAIQAMPLPWRKRLAALLSEAEDAGLQTPDYVVYRDDPELTLLQQDPEDENSTIGAEIIQPDPWADYRHDTLAKVQELCPDFQPPRIGAGDQSTAAQADIVALQAKLTAVHAATIEECARVADRQVEADRKILAEDATDSALAFAAVLTSRDIATAIRRLVASTIGGEHGG